MSDLISRKKALQAIVDITTCENVDGIEIHCDASVADSEGWLGGVRDALRAIENLPSAEPERNKGRWVPVDSYTAFGGDEMTWLAHGNPIAYHYCSECKNHAYALEDGEDLLSDFCPNCGAEMTRGE